MKTGNLDAFFREKCLTKNIINVNIKMYTYDQIRMYTFPILRLALYILLVDRIYL